ncbi:MAG TPA: sterol desaturase family protein [Solirubrobacteraceae bacterium]|jgi:sterol desaturase/sphingolipid hydroxylase (fatty acid hydroxylase superfamily)|nr:sterol desaturase family protein [Solirubrobacteraceae bacterium]
MDPDSLTPDLDSPRLTAPAEAVQRRGGKGAVSLADCARVFARQPSPPYLLAAILIAVALRVPQGHWSWRDAVVAAGLVAVTPFVEWLIHVYLLHLPPFMLLGRRIEIVSAREHRAHHEDPGVLSGVLLPVSAVIVFALTIAAVAYAMSFPIALVLGGDRLAGAATGLVAAYAILAVYEWIHFLIHTPYRPKRRYFKAIWRNHRLHHFKNERYWFGVTSTVGDRVIGTAPDQRAVERSPTAHSLHAQT